MTSDEAFEFLKQEANQELKAVQEQGAAHLGRGNLAEARQALDHAEQVKGMLASLQDLKGRWKLLAVPAAPIQRHPRKRREYVRLEPGRRTPTADFYIPILRVLVEMGGRGPTKQALIRVGEILESRLTADDRLPLLSTPELRWRDTVSWARIDLKEMGYLSVNSPRGIWEITPAGRVYLEKNQGKGLNQGK